MFSMMSSKSIYKTEATKHPLKPLVGLVIAMSSSVRSRVLVGETAPSSIHLLQPCVPLQCFLDPSSGCFQLLTQVSNVFHIQHRRSSQVYPSTA